MKIALVTDTHLGARSDSLVFNEFFFKFWEGVFFPYIEKHNIKRVIHLGDVVDRRKFINYVILNSFRTRFVNRILKNDIKLDVLVGNHDVPFRNTNDINAISELFGHHQNINIISDPTVIEYDGFPIAMIPWINNSNYEKTMEFIRTVPAQIAMSHLELSGFEMDRGNVCANGMDRDIFQKFEMVMSGHFHHRSSDGHIFYLGNPYEITWSDYNDRRGFHIFDTETRELEFIENPHKMFHKVVYDDTDETLESIEAKDFSEYENTIIKVVVTKKDNAILFEKFMEGIYKNHPHDVTIVEDFTEVGKVSDSDIVDQSDDTITIVNKVIDTFESSLDKEKLKSVMRNLYEEAQNLGTRE